MSWFLCTLSKEHPGNWNLCKEVGLWGISTHGTKVYSERGAPGDRLLVWRSGQGYVAEAVVTDKARRPRGRDEAPWLGGVERFGLVVPFEITFETKEPFFLGFKDHRQLGSGLSLFMLRRGFIRIPDKSAQEVMRLWREQATSQPTRQS